MPPVFENNETSGYEGNLNFDGLDTPYLPTDLPAEYSKTLTTLYYMLTGLDTFKFWLDSTNISTLFQKWSNDPLDLIVGAYVLPVSSDFIPPTSTPEVLKIGGQEISGNIAPTGIRIYEYLSEIITPTIKIQEYFGSFLDYAPYTDIKLFIPFYGYVDLDPALVMNKEIRLRYRVDTRSGATQIFVEYGDDTTQYLHSPRILTVEADISYRLPLSGKDAREYWQNITQLGGKFAAATALSLAAFPAIATAGTTAAMMGVGGAAVAGAVSNIGTGAKLALTQPRTRTLGEVSSITSHLNCFIPHIVINRPEYAMPESYGRVYGFPINSTREFSTLQGYTEVSGINFSLTMGDTWINYYNSTTETYIRTKDQYTQTPTESELNEIIRLLREGIIFMDAQTEKNFYVTEGAFQRPIYYPGDTYNAE